MQNRHQKLNIYKLLLIFQLYLPTKGMKLPPFLMIILIIILPGILYIVQKNDILL